MSRFDDYDEPRMGNTLMLNIRIRQGMIQNLIFKRISDPLNPLDSGGRLLDMLDFSNYRPILDIGSVAYIGAMSEVTPVGDTLKLPSGRYVLLLDVSVERYSEMLDDISYAASELELRIVDRGLRAKRSVAANLKSDQKKITMRDRKFMRRL